MTVIIITIPDSDNMDGMKMLTLPAVHLAALLLHRNEPMTREEMDTLAKLLEKPGSKEMKLILILG